ncbi:hypothetical protein J6590_040441 [Homalodisca vitripennis]|nr:hypothetical protein J6590_040441 [Homalodisca vitripennis]
MENPINPENQLTTSKCIVVSGECFTLVASCLSRKLITEIHKLTDVRVEKSNIGNEEQAQSNIGEPRTSQDYKLSYTPKFYWQVQILTALTTGKQTGENNPKRWYCTGSKSINNTLHRTNEGGTLTKKYTSTFPEVSCHVI